MKKKRSAQYLLISVYPSIFFGSIYTIYGFLASEKYMFCTCSPLNPLILRPAYTRYKRSLGCDIRALKPTILYPYDMMRTDFFNPLNERSYIDLEDFCLVFHKHPFTIEISVREMLKDVFPTKKKYV